ncbi:MAG TPA: hypothetical protein VGE37_04705, partial [Archangium sp.]
MKNLALLGLTFMACDPSYTISGHVRGLDGGALGGIPMTLECNGQPVRNVDSVNTDDAGSFEFQSLGCLPKN